MTCSWKARWPLSTSAWGARPIWRSTGTPTKPCGSSPNGSCRCSRTSATSCTNTAGIRLLLFPFFSREIVSSRLGWQGCESEDHPRVHELVFYLQESFGSQVHLLPGQAAAGEESAELLGVSFLRLGDVAGDHGRGLPLGHPAHHGIHQSRQE